MKCWTPIVVVLALVISQTFARPEPIEYGMSSSNHEDNYQYDVSECDDIDSNEDDYDQDMILQTDSKAKNQRPTSVSSQKGETNTTESSTSSPGPTKVLQGSSSPGSRSSPCPPKDQSAKCVDERECLYENPGQCSTYIKCNEKGEAVIEECLPGQEWKDDQKICAFPLFSKCSQPE